MLNNRQKSILELIEKNGQMNAKEILAILAPLFDVLSKPTLLRDLSKLIKNELIKKQGNGPSISYIPQNNKKVLAYIDADNYFAGSSPDQRKIIDIFNWNIFSQLSGLFLENELEELKKLNDHYKKQRELLPAAALKKEFERLTVELSWKSSQLEGNTYSLIDTEILLSKSKESPGHTKEEATMILNHKGALDFILSKSSHFQNITPEKIRELHLMLVKDLNIPNDFRKVLVGIVGTKFRPLDNQWQIKESLDKMCSLINNEKEPIAKAMVASLLTAYIQPFVDGNKRTSRLLADAILVAYDWCPLSYRSIDESQYKKAVLLFYEQNNLRLFKELFVEQFKFAVANYFSGKNNNLR